MPIPHDGLELEQDLTFQRRSWRIQRVGWVLLLFVVLAALAGLAGSGPLSRGTQAAQDGSCRLEYERFARMHAPSQLRLHFEGQAVRAGEVRIWLARGYLEQAMLEQVVPLPERVELGEDRLTFVFSAQDGQPGVVTFHLQPQTFGRLYGRMGVGETTLDFRQLVYP